MTITNRLKKEKNDTKNIEYNTPTQELCVQKFDERKFRFQNRTTIPYLCRECKFKRLKNARHIDYKYLIISQIETFIRIDAINYHIQTY